MTFSRLLALTLACSVALPALAQTGAPSGTANRSVTTQSKGDASSSDKATTKSTSTGKIDPRNALQVKNGQTRKQTFDAIDRNRDGYISHDEAGAVPALLVMFAQADRNSDDRLSPAEFAAVPIVQANGSKVR